MSNTVIVTGSRKYNIKQFNFIYKCLDMFSWEIGGIKYIVEGGAQGADKAAKEWAKSKGIHYATVPALWDYYDKKAGSKRNSAMLDMFPHAYVAGFPLDGSIGTWDCIRKAENLGFVTKVFHYYE